MGLTFNTTKLDQYIRIDVTGKYNYDDFIKLASLIMETSEVHKEMNILVYCLDVTNNNPPMMDRFHAGVLFGEKIPYGIRIAGVWEQQYINKFLETVANNRMTRVKAFGNEVDALKWLIEDPLISAST